MLSNRMTENRRDEIAAPAIVMNIMLLSKSRTFSKVPAPIVTELDMTNKTQLTLQVTKDLVHLVEEKMGLRRGRTFEWKARLG